MGDGLRKLRSGTTRANVSFRKHLSRIVATRVAGAAVGTAGIALMGFGTIASPTVSGGFQFAPTADTTTTSDSAPLTAATTTTSSTSSGQQTIASISESCASAVTTGTLVVNGAVSGDSVTLEVFAKNEQTANWVATGATDTIQMVTGTTNYSYSISGVPAQYSDGTVSGDAGNDPDDNGDQTDDYNSWRVQVSNTSGTFAGTATKSASFTCSAPGTTTSSSKTTSSSTTTSSRTTTSITSSTPGSSTTTATPGTSTTSRTTSASGAGVAGVSTSTPSTGASIAFGVGLGLLVIGGGLLFGVRPLLRRRKK